ncbi:MAG: serine/threonine protein kinase [Thermoanaerobaculia bacterium]
MLDIGAIRTAFPEMDALLPLQASGQKHVLRGTYRGTPAALKLIKQTADMKEKLEREISAAEQLECDYVPKIYETGERSVDGEVRAYIIEQFIDGETLRARLTREPRQTLGFALKLARVLLTACVDFERRQFVHRDIKPENIIIDSDGKVWVIDFGIVRFLQLESLTPTMAQWGRFTLGYGAPEQMRNLKPAIDARTDLFAVGVVLFEALYGQNPFYEGKSNEVDVIRHMTQQDLPLLDIAGDENGRFADFIRALTARFPSRRPQTAREALAWFEKVERGSR